LCDNWGFPRAAAESVGKVSWEGEPFLVTVTDRH